MSTRNGTADRWLQTIESNGLYFGTMAQPNVCGIGQEQSSSGQSKTSTFAKKDNAYRGGGGGVLIDGFKPLSQVAFTLQVNKKKNEFTFGPSP